MDFRYFFIASIQNTLGRVLETAKSQHCFAKMSVPRDLNFKIMYSLVGFDKLAVLSVY